MAEYYILNADPNDDYCALYDFAEEFHDIEMPSDGVRMGELYAGNQTFRMADEVRGHLIADVINNAFGYLIVSSRLKKLLEVYATAEIEYLPIRIQNHKGRIASDDCFIVNIIGTVDCVDMERTEGTPDPVNEGWLMSIEELHLDTNRITPSLNLFRINVMPSVIIVRDDLRQRMEEEGINGAEFLEMGDEVSL